MSPESLQIRWCGRLAGWLVVTSVLVHSGTLSAQQAGKTTAKEDYTLSSLRDGWPIHLTYYPSRLKENAAVVVLLHMKGGSRLIWTRKGGLAERLQGQGFAVIAADLRRSQGFRGTYVSVADDGQRFAKWFERAQRAWP